MNRGERLRSLRESKGLNQKEMASLLNVTKSTVCTYEKERRNPPIDTLIRYSELFGVAVDYILGIDKIGINEDVEEYNHVVLTNNEVTLLELIRKDRNLYEILFNDPKRGMDLLKRKIG